MHRTRVGLFAPLMASLALLALCGCGGQERALEKQISAFADLTGARRSPLEKLAQEIERIEAEGGTPRRLTVAPPSDGDNAAAVLIRMFDAPTRAALLEATEQLMPRGEFAFSPPAWEMALQLVEARRRDLQTSALALSRPRCEFAVAVDKGFFYSPWFLENVTIVCRLHLLAAGEALHAENRDQAMSEVETAWRWISELDKAPLISARLTACRLRREAFSVIEAIAQDELAPKLDLERMARLVRSRLDAWPADGNVLVADRAVALHAYEAIRGDMLDDLLTVEEKAAFIADDLMSPLRNLEPPALDADELAYLEIMQKYIDACDKPFFEREETFAEIESHLNALRGGPDYPHLAATLFLADVPSALRQMAADRALCEGWMIALGQAAGLLVDDFVINPVHGKPYQVIRRVGELEVDLALEDERNPLVRVPVR